MRGPPPVCAIGAMANRLAVLLTQGRSDDATESLVRNCDRAWWYGAIWMALAVAPVGCESKPPLAPVTGKVTHAGQPVVGANVLFQPEKGLASGAITGDDGRFELQVPNDRRSGAVPGKHRVSILKPAAEQPPPREVRLSRLRPPRRPWRLHTSVEVTASGPNEFTFDIPQPPGRERA